MGRPESWSSERRAIATSMREQGLSASQISRRMNVSKSAVNNAFVRWGMAKPVASHHVDTRADERIPPRANDDQKHLQLLLAALREQRGAA